MNQLVDTTVPFRLNAARVRAAAIAILAIVLTWSIWVMESRFAGLSVSEITLDETTPVTLYRPTSAEPLPLPLVVVAHGFGGSRQMMDQIAVSIARGGFAVASFDFPGHGRHAGFMSRDITRVEGTTAQLVAVTNRVADAMSAREDIADPVSFVGHSMATDVIIRAAAQREDVGVIAAISMYSPAVTASHPRELIVLSGAFENRLREAALATMHQLVSDAQEGETLTLGETTRRVSVAPYVGHVGVLYSETTLAEVVDWLRIRLGHGQAALLDGTGWVSGLLLGALVLLAWPLAHAFLPRMRTRQQTIEPRIFWVAIILPVPVILVLALLPILGIGGIAGFGSLGLMLAAWGLIQLIVLYRAGIAVERPDALGTAAFLFWGLAIYAFALDRYGAHFLPSGPRLPIMVALTLAALPLMIADTSLTHAAPIWRRVVARVSLIVALGFAMGLAPTELGLTFTVLPVLVLFFVVYGSFARWIAARRGAGGVWLGKAVALAWSIAASTPLFVAGAIP